MVLFNENRRDRNEDADHDKEKLDMRIREH